MNEQSLRMETMTRRLTAMILFAVLTAISPSLSTAIETTTIKHSVGVNTELTESELETVKAWNLSADEYLQIKHLKTEYQGLLSPAITPLEWLGIFAISDERRNHYARLFAQRQLHTTMAILQFETAYANAIAELTAETQQTTQQSDRLLLITSFLCTDSTCTDQLRDGLKHVRHGGSLDIYVQNEFDVADLKSWAIANQIPLRDLRHDRITIRQAKGRMVDVKPGIYRVK